MKKFKGTPGKWRIRCKALYRNTFEINSGKGSGTEIEDLANMRLISKAPEMLEFLMQLARDFEGDFMIDGEIVDEPDDIYVRQYKEAKQLLKKIVR